MKNAIEKLMDAVQEKDSRIVAGLDPKQNIIPNCKDLGRKELLHYCREYIRAVKEDAAAIKINSAFFETLRAEMQYLDVAQIAHDEGLFVIGDVKRADIGSTSEAYAKAFLGEDSPFDAITVNPYFGTDGVQPFIDLAVKNNKAIFILVKTSNKSSAEIQDLELKDGRKVYHKVAELVNQWGAQTTLNKYGYNCVGAVVGATHPNQAKELRNLMPNTFFLIPGYGEQGATAKDVAVNFKDGKGAIINSSRGLMAAYKKDEYKDCYWYDATRLALKKAKEEINLYCK